MCAPTWRCATGLFDALFTVDAPAKKTAKKTAKKPAKKTAPAPKPA